MMQIQTQDHLNEQWPSIGWTNHVNHYSYRSATVPVYVKGLAASYFDKDTSSTGMVVRVMVNNIPLHIERHHDWMNVFLHHHCLLNTPKICRENVITAFTHHQTLRRLRAHCCQVGIVLRRNPLRQHHGKLPPWKTIHVNHSHWKSEVYFSGLLIHQTGELP